MTGEIRMKKLFALLLALVLVLFLAACGSKETPNNPDNTNNPSQSLGSENEDNNGGESVKATQDNWLEVVHNAFGFELKLPDGWTTTDVTDYGFIYESTTPDITVYTKLKKALSEEEYAAELDKVTAMVFEQLKTIAIGDITNSDQSVVFASAEDCYYSHLYGFVSLRANIDDNGKAVSIGFSPVRYADFAKIEIHFIGYGD